MSYDPEPISKEAIESLKKVMKIPCMEPDSIRIKRFTNNMKRDAYREELKNVLTPSEEFNSMAAKITQPFSIDKAIHG